MTTTTTATKKAKQPAADVSPAAKSKAAKKAVEKVAAPAEPTPPTVLTKASTTPSPASVKKTSNEDAKKVADAVVAIQTKKKYTRTMPVFQSMVERICEDFGVKCQITGNLATVSLNGHKSEVFF